MPSYRKGRYCVHNSLYSSVQEDLISILLEIKSGSKQCSKPYKQEIQPSRYER